MKRKWLTLVVALLIIISSVAVKPAMAYFTDTLSTEKMLELELGDGKLVPMEDTVENMIKKVSITNTGDYPVFVRAKALYPDNITVEVVPSDGWTSGEDGYMYYSSVVNQGTSTGQLQYKITADETVTDDFNVIIIQEATKVIYDESGAETGDWDAAISAQITEEVR